MSDTNNNENWLYIIRNFLKPSRTIPITSWRAESTWGLINGYQSLQRFLILIFGLTVFGIGEAFLVVTSLGNSPWVVLSEGISLNSNLNIGQATFLVSIVVLFFWIPLRQKPGFGTLANIVVIAVAIELGLLIIPEVESISLKLFYVLFGILLVGIGSALYITCGLGTGPRDGLMTGLHYRTGVRVGRVRLGIEVLALTTGALLGGSLGVGTALFALFIGQSVAISLGVLGRLTSK
ncbi:MAG: putative membrane protein [actinobacterium acIB-AMD-7]|nr:MAG: putative membrane protein [actinobacterium acIB-AMD-7]